MLNNNIIIKFHQIIVKRGSSSEYITLDTVNNHKYNAYRQKLFWPSIIFKSEKGS